MIFSVYSWHDSTQLMLTYVLSEQKQIFLTINAYQSSMLNELHHDMKTLKTLKRNAM